MLDLHQYTNEPIAADKPTNDSKRRGGVMTNQYDGVDQDLY